MKRESLNLQVLDLARDFIAKGFADIKENNPEYYEEIKKIMYGKNIPGYIAKYIERTRDKLHRDLAIEEVMKRKGLSKGQMVYLFRKGYTLTEINKMK